MAVTVSPDPTPGPGLVALTHNATLSVGVARELFPGVELDAPIVVRISPPDAPAPTTNPALTPQRRYLLRVALAALVPPEGAPFDPVLSSAIELLPELPPSTTLADLPAKLRPVLLDALERFAARLRPGYVPALDALKTDLTRLIESNEPHDSPGNPATPHPGKTA